MLTLPFIRANQETTIAGLQKKHFANAAEIVAKLIAQDDQRKALLQQAESALEKSNAAAKKKEKYHFDSGFPLLLSTQSTINLLERKQTSPAKTNYEISKMRIMASA